MNKRLTPADMEHIRRAITAQVIKVEKQLKMPWLEAQRFGYIKMEPKYGQRPSGDLLLLRHGLKTRA